MKAVVTFVIVTAISLSAMVVLAQRETQNVPPSRVEIINPSDVKLFFSTSCDQGRSWNNFNLNPGYNGMYSCEGEQPASLLLRIVTALPGSPQRELRYTLAWGQRFELYFDPRNSAWGVLPVQK